MQVQVPWSTGTVPVEIDESLVAGVLGANVERAGDPEGVLRDALEAPGAGLEAFLAQAPSPLLVVVNDATRPTPSAEVLRAIRADLEEWLEGGDRELSLVVATGTHRVALRAGTRTHLRQGVPRRPRRAHLLARLQGRVTARRSGPDVAGRRRPGEPAVGRGAERHPHQLGGAALLRRLHGRRASRCFPVWPAITRCGPTTRCR